MKFTSHKRRAAPAVIIISLIDILIVLLIFLMVTTTFKNQPAIKLALPEARNPKPGGSQNAFVINVAPVEPHYYLNDQPVTLSRLQEELTRAAAANPKATVGIRSDEGTPFGIVLQVVEAAQAAKIQMSSIYVKPAGQ